MRSIFLSDQPDFNKLLTKAAEGIVDCVLEFQSQILTDKVLYEMRWIESGSEIKSIKNQKLIEDDEPGSVVLWCAFPALLRRFEQEGKVMDHPLVTATIQSDACLR